MAYAVKETFLTLQGEGARTGRVAVFCRFAGCNLWSGNERDRAKAVCRFCDTDFIGTDGFGGGHFATAEKLALHVVDTWGRPAEHGHDPKYVVFTGGEPLLQLDEALVEACHARGFEVAVETNGTRPAPAGIDWICVSPKAGAELVQTTGHELKLVFPQEGIDPAGFSELAFPHLYLQPMDGPSRDQNTDDAVRYCIEHPRWRLSLQTHKLLGIP